MSISSLRSVDLDAYFERIAYEGPRVPTLETLRALHERHPAAIPFEAIDVMLDRGVDIAPAAVDAKLIEAGRGGYCFEHNGLFKRVLGTMGFDVESLIARVQWMAPENAPAHPRSHMGLRVTIDGVPWLADVGFGGCVSSEPLRMDTNEPQKTRHVTFRLAPSDDGLRVEALLGDKWAPLYDLCLDPQHDVDYEPANWFTSTHPDSHFRHHLMVARTTPEAQFALSNNRLTIRKPDGGEDQRVLNADELAEVLRDLFGLPVEPSWRQVLERIAAAGN